jgi:hypothetical protein
MHGFYYNHEVALKVPIRLLLNDEFNLVTIDV